MNGRRAIAGALVLLALALWYFAIFQTDVTVGTDSQRVANLQLLFQQLALILIGCAFFIGGCALFAPPPPRD